MLKSLEQRARELAAEIKTTITFEQLLGLMDASRATGPRVSLDELGVSATVQFGWSLDAEQRLAELILPVLDEAALEETARVMGRRRIPTVRLPACERWQGIDFNAGAVLVPAPVGDADVE